MELLIRRLKSAFLVTVVSSTSLAAVPPEKEQAELDPAVAKALQEASGRLCRSTDEYVKTLKFLRETKEITFHEETSRKIADQVSKGCDGAAQRFSTVLLMLKTVGLSARRSLAMALEFSAQSPDVQKNFVEIFTKSFLMEFFDYEYQNAMNVAIELSRDYKGDPARAREDFIDLVRFCKGSKTLDLPMSLCAEYMVRIAKLSQYHRGGVAKPFKDFLNDLREKKELSLDIKTALKVAQEVLGYGPLAPRNFFEAYEFSRKDLDFDKKKALQFAVDLSSRSFVGDEPPLMQIAPPPKPQPSPAPDLMGLP